MQTLTENNISLDLREAAAQAAQLQQVTVPEEALEGVLDFVARRLEQLLVDEGCGVEAVKAVLSERGSNPAVAAQSARELQVSARTTSCSNYAWLAVSHDRLKSNAGHNLSMPSHDS